MQRRVRFVRPAGNALRRRSDRIESAIVAGLLAFFVLAGPASAVVAGSLTDHAMLGQVRAEQSWHQNRGANLRDVIRLLNMRASTLGNSGDRAGAAELSADSQRIVAAR